MFDVGFWELAIVALVALVVVGPERLPKLARTAGLWVGKGRRFVSQVKADIDREIKAEELKQILDKQAKSNPLQEVIDETAQSLSGLKQDTEKAVNTVKTEFESDPREDPPSKQSDGNK